MPLIQAAHEAFGGKVDVLAIGQDAEGNASLIKDYALTVPMLDDSALHTSFAYDIDTVPTIILAKPDGTEVSRFVGFGTRVVNAPAGRLHICLRRHEPLLLDGG